MAFVLGAVWAAGVVALVGAGLVALRFSATDVAGPVVVGGGALLVLGWALVPLVAFGVDETLDPSRFATFGVQRRRLVPGLLVSGLLGLPGAVTVLLGAGAVVTFSRTPAATAFAVPALAVTVLTAVAASRMTTTAAAALLRRRRTRDALVVLGGLLLVSFGPLFNVVVGRASTGLAELGRSVAGVAGWTPPGYGVAAAADAAAGRWGLAALRLLLALVVLALVVLVWAVALGPAGTGPAGRPRRPPPPTSAATRSWTGCRTPRRGRPRRPSPCGARATGAGTRATSSAPPRSSSSRCSSSCCRCPRAARSVRGPWPRAPRSRSSWAGRCTTTSPTTTRRSRCTSRPGCAVATTGRAACSRPGCGNCRCWSWPPWPAASSRVAASWCRRCWGEPGALRSLARGVVRGQRARAVPGPAPGANPFQTPKGASAATVGVQFGTSAATTVLALPTLVPAVVAFVGPSWVGWIALPVGLVTGIVLPWVGIVQGGSVLDRRAPEVLARVSSS